MVVDEAPSLASDAQPDDDLLQPLPIRGGWSLLSWSLFRGASLATFLRSIDQHLYVDLALWQVDLAEPDPRYDALRTARWRLFFVMPFLFLLLCYAIFWLLPVTFDWNRSWLFARYAFSTALICDLVRRLAPRAGKGWIEWLVSGVTFSAFVIPLIVVLFPSLAWLESFRLDHLLARWISGETLIAIVLAMVSGAIMTTAGLAGSIFVVISALAIGLIGQPAFGAQLDLWIGLALGLALGLVIAPVVDLLLGALIVVGFFQAAGSFTAWAAARTDYPFDGSRFAAVASLAFLVTHLRIVRYLVLQFPRALYLRFQTARQATFEPELWMNHPLRTDETVRFPLPGLVLLLRSVFQRGEQEDRGMVLYLLANIGAISGQRMMLPWLIRDLAQREMCQAANIFQIIRFREILAWLPTARCPPKEQRLLAALSQICEQLAESVSTDPQQRRQRFEELAAQVEQLRRNLPVFTLPQVRCEPSVRRRWRQRQAGSWRSSDNPIAQRQSILFLSAPFIRVTPPLPLNGYRKALAHWNHLILQSLNRPIISPDPVSTLDGDGMMVRIIPAGSPLFRGYAALFRTIEERVMDESQPVTLLLLGQPLIGKTTMLNQLTQRLNPQIIPVIFDLAFRPEGFEETIIMPVALAEGIRSAAQQAHYGISIRPFPYALGEGAPRPYDLFLAWVEDAVVPMLGDQQRLLIMFNHYEMLPESQTSDAFFAALRRLIEIAPVTIGLCGNLPPERCDSRWTTTLVGATQYYRIVLPLMQAEDAQATLQYLIAAQTGVRLADAAAKRIAQQCGGHPYLLQLAAQAVMRLIQQRRDLLLVDDVIQDGELVRDALIQVRDNLDEFVDHYVRCLERITDLPEVNRDLFLSLATNRPTNQSIHSNLQAIVLQHLRLWQIIEERNGETRPTLPLIEEWARQLFTTLEDGSE